MPKHNEPQYKTKANAKGVIYAYTRVDGQQVALGVHIAIVRQEGEGDLPPRSLDYKNDVYLAK